LLGELVSVSWYRLLMACYPLLYGAPGMINVT
jgi:hypothetical protein